MSFYSGINYVKWLFSFLELLCIFGLYSVIDKVDWRVFCLTVGVSMFSYLQGRAVGNRWCASDEQ